MIFVFENNEIDFFFCMKCVIREMFRKLQVKLNEEIITGKFLF